MDDSLPVQENESQTSRMATIDSDEGIESLSSNLSMSSNIYEGNLFHKKILYPFGYKISLRKSKFVYIPRPEIDLYRTPLQRKLYYFFEEPQSKKAQAFACFSTLCIFFTIIIICLDSLPTFFVIKNVNIHLWLPFDIIIVLVFTVDYFGRFFASPKKWKYVIMPSNILNLISIVPFYVQILSPFSADTTLRFTRILRLTRILKSLERIGTFSDGFMITTNIIILSLIRIFLNSIYFILILLLSATLIYYAERGEFDSTTSTWYRKLPSGETEQSPFQSVFHGLYWSIATMTTTGYGDIIPITALGQCVGALTALSGILVIATTSAIIGINSDLEWSKYQRNKIKVTFLDMWQAIDDKDIYNASHSEQNKRIKTLEFHHHTLASLIEDIQKNFNEINGIESLMYVTKYKELRIDNNQAIEKLSKLEFEMKKYELLLGNIDDYEPIDLNQKNR
ncbi:hypothetical protein C1645_814385 [Glomus cerebriforme]|uniref:Ion transport domain-containing protein n=1 Tax=Glomus cerebriforme TaxID=658196 RepID=A0A397TQK7_9GLOM|nr:hypothetical protein C1645_814385 [Glomus cerebriforme]